MPSIPVNSLEPNSRAVTRTAVDLFTLRPVPYLAGRVKPEFRLPCHKQGTKSRPARLLVKHEASWNTSRSKLEWDLELL